jgi:hypothetical protein
MPHAWALVETPAPQPADAASMAMIWGDPAHEAAAGMPMAGHRTYRCDICGAVKIR